MKYDLEKMQAMSIEACLTVKCGDAWAYPDGSTLERRVGSPPGQDEIRSPSFGVRWRVQGGEVSLAMREMRRQRARFEAQV